MISTSELIIFCVLAFLGIVAGFMSGIYQEERAEEHDDYMDR